MKKRSPESSLKASPPSEQVRDRKSQAAIETVFRLTHNREMTDAERKSFGIDHSDGSSETSSS